MRIKYLKAIYGILILLFFTSIVDCQSVQTGGIDLGKLVKWSKTESGLLLKTEKGKLEIKIWTPEIIRVRVTVQKDFTNDFSFSVINENQKARWSIEETKSALWIRTDSIEVAINKTPVLIKYLNKQKKLVLGNDDFGHYYSGNELGCYFNLNDDERFIGLGEKTGNLDRRGNGYTNWNTDCFGYTPDTDPLYSSVPFYMGIHDSLVYGVFLDQPTKSHFNFGASNIRFSSFSVEGPEMRYFYIAGNNVPEIIRNYTYLTGRMPIPPKWSLGYHQSRWSYFPDKKVLNLAETFRQKNIPLDVIHLDIHYMEDYKIFTWDKTRFPEPGEMIKKLKFLGVNTTVIIDPGIKVDKNYDSYNSGLKEGIFLKYPDGTLYSGSVWPGLCHFPDFTMTKARNWWSNSFSVYTKVGVAGFWNDMNEPATWGQKFPALVKFDFEGNPKFTIDGRNIYGLEMARATYEGARQSMNNQRPFVLSRAGFSGIQRYSAIWTGDNTANEDHLLLGIRLVNSLGLSGVSFCGTDVGGFAQETSNSLYARWITIGTFTPFFRGHKMINMKDSEPWSFGEETEEIARNYIRLRYKLIPYIYSCFNESSVSGMPVARSLAISIPFDNKVYNSEYQNQFLFGPSILIAASKSTDAFVNVYFPKGRWYNLYSGELLMDSRNGTFASPDYKLAAFIKASAIIPAQKVLQSLSQGRVDTLDIHIYYGEEMNTFNFYDDDGISYDYEKGIKYQRQISFNPDSRSIKLSKVNGCYNPNYNTLRLLLHGFKGQNYSVNSKPDTVNNIRFSWLDLYRHLYYAPNENEEVGEIILKNVREEIEIKWN